jgi:hypothetical protein
VHGDRHTDAALDGAFTGIVAMVGFSLFIVIGGFQANGDAFSYTAAF